MDCERELKSLKKSLKVDPLTRATAYTASCYIWRRGSESFENYRNRGSIVLLLVSLPVSYPAPMNRLRRVRVSLVLLLASGTAFASEPGKTLRVYFVGNSVTDTVRYGSLAKLAASRQHTLVWGRQMIPGAPLQWLWEHPTEGFTEKPYQRGHVS